MRRFAAVERERDEPTFGVEFRALSPALLDATKAFEACTRADVDAGTPWTAASADGSSASICFCKAARIATTFIMIPLC